MIEVLNVSKKFGTFAALDKLSLYVPSGAVYGLVGPNGAGKTTLIRHLNGVLRQDSGQVRIDGQPVFENRAVKQRMLCIPDALYFFGSESIAQLKNFYKDVYPTFDENRYAQLKDVFCLDEKMPLRRFSKGMQKQACFYLSICCKPEILILDEPVDGLDPVMRRQIWSLLLDDCAQREMTVLVSSHNLRELEDVCSWVGIMHRGKMLLERSLDSLQENVVKVQLVSELPLSKDLDILHEQSSGRIRTLIIRGKQDEIVQKLHASHPMLCDLVPLSLEEIFIYELGGVDYDIKNIVL